MLQRTRQFHPKGFGIKTAAPIRGHDGIAPAWPCYIAPAVSATEPISMIHRGGVVMAVESTGDSPGNPRLYKVIEHAPKTGKSPTVWAWPQLIDYLKVAGQPVQGPWPPHQQRRPDPEAESLPVAVPDSGK